MHVQPKAESERAQRHQPEWRSCSQTDTGRARARSSGVVGIFIIDSETHDVVASKGFPVWLAELVDFVWVREARRGEGGKQGKPGQRTYE